MSADNGKLKTWTHDFRSLGDPSNGSDFYFVVSEIKARDLTAVEGADYLLFSTMLTVPDDETKAVTVAGMADGLNEGTELFEISIVPNTAYNVGTPSKATVYIRDIAGSEMESETGDGTTDDSKFAKMVQLQYKLG